MPRCLAPYAAFWSLLLCAGPTGAAEAEPVRLTVADVVILGDAPRLAVAGLRPGEEIAVHAFRRALRSQNVEGEWRSTPVLAHAWATFAADSAGRVDVDAATPLEGTYAGPDALGLLWSGFPAAAPEVEGLPRPADALPDDTQTWSLRVERDGAFVARRDVTLRDYGEGVALTEVAVGDARGDGASAGISGVFAAPANASSLPALILLHGSEGASVAASRRWAGRMAERGFPSLALHYVAYRWNGGGIDGVSDTFANVPIEVLDAARTWLATRSEVDATRIGVLGVSKGAEMALVGGGRDEVWPSLPMAEALAETLRDAGAGESAELLAFPEAGHGVCNTGGRLERFDPVPTDPAIEARANAEAFARTVDFLRASLGGSAP